MESIPSTSTISIESTPLTHHTVGAMARLVEEGEDIDAWVSEAAPELSGVVQDYPIAALQTEYSLWSREPEDGLLALCEELGVGFVAYSPLGRGFLTGEYGVSRFAPDDFRRMSPRFQGENLTRIWPWSIRIKEIAHEKNCTPAQLALAWVRPAAGTLAIPGPK